MKKETSTMQNYGEVEIEGVIYTWKLDRGLITVSAPLSAGHQQKAAQLGGGDLATIAIRLAKNLHEERPQ